MNRALTLFIALFCLPSLQAQDKFTISGIITSAKTGETIIGASIKLQDHPSGTTSNEYGFFSVTLSKGKYVLEISAVGQAKRLENVTLDRNIKLDITLDEQQRAMDSVVVSSVPIPGRSLTNPLMGVEHLNISATKNIPVIFGERDILKTIQLLPGIKSAGEGNSGFFVRGGAADQNLILLDEAPVYNASHLLGFFSTFNSDAIKDVTVYKGGMPAQYGGRLSSVLDIKMNDGNNQQLGINGGVGLIAARVNVEGPLEKDRSSFLLSGRRTYADMFLKLSSDTAVKNSRIYFYDLNAKLNYKLGSKDRLFLSGYFGRDKMSYENQFGIAWGNGTGTLRWNHIYNSKLFANTSLLFSNYNYLISIKTEANNFDIFSQIRDWNIKEEFQWYLNANHSLRIGINSIYYAIHPGEISASDNSTIGSLYLQKRYSWENTVYLNDDWKMGSRVRLSYGLRLTSFSVLGGGDFYNVDLDGNILDTLHYNKGHFIKTYMNPEPRVSASYRLSSTSSVKLAYVRNVQHLHLISNSTSASPTDKWIPSNNLIRPEISDQVSVGFYKNLLENKYELTVEAYYKAMQNQIDYRDGANVFTNDAIETQLLFGRGRAYGVEWLFKKKVERFTGWISYTLSKTERNIRGINYGQWYNARQDRTHDIAVVSFYRLNKKWTLSANWIYYTGDAVTFPAGKYIVDNRVVFYYTRRNQYRLPDYHRLDLGATLQLKQKERFSSELVISIFNAYGRQNAYMISFRESKNEPGKTEAVQTALFRFVPSVSYNFKF